MNVLIAFAGDMNGSGGMQHACMTLANMLEDCDYRVTIAYGDTSKRDPFYRLHDNIVMKPFTEFAGREVYGTLGSQISFKDKLIRESIRPFSRKKAREWNQKSKAHVIRKGIASAVNSVQPDIIISFGADMTYYLFDSHVNVPVMTLFRVEPKYVLSIAPRQEIEAVRKSALVQVQLPFFADEVISYCAHVLIMTIPNPVRQILNRPCNRSHVIINVARIDKRQKRQHILLEAFALIADKFPDWTLEFWGNTKSHAAYSEELKNRIRALHLEDRVFFKGETKNVDTVYDNASIFAFPSAFEGFPNALAEAMAHGLPVLGMKDCPSSEALISDGKDGMLAKDVEDLSLKLTQLISDKQKREQMGQAAKEAMKAYAPEIIGNQWKKAINQAVFSHDKL